MQELAVIASIVFGILLVAAVILLLILSRRTTKTRTATQTRGVQTKGTEASLEFSSREDLQTLQGHVRSLLSSNHRYADLRELPNGFTLRVKGNFWTLGTTIECTVEPVPEGLRGQATAQPRLKTTMVDYGQSGKELLDFLDEIPIDHNLTK
ncbi:hypothetical protein GCM10027404_33040 [Arthrobacter tumbae]|uniref:hypothetical protein n=1 Tax=Arthrobacter tumbae TaxID=163874 RepID=UPI0019578C6E|nr:hypothetical protein [Arthrobacter tumbae]MBM7781785.1 hypothetical protein [Arthrobacter tumbae]